MYSRSSSGQRASGSSLNKVAMVFVKASLVSAVKGDVIGILGCVAEKCAEV